MRRGDRWAIAAIMALLVLSFGVRALFAYFQRGAGMTAVISQDGMVYRRIDLLKVAEPYEFKVVARDGAYNIIRVEPGRIRVIEANCPEQIDVLQGWISRPGQSIICLPHRLVIIIQGRETEEDEEDIDGISG
ncbi:MAG: NusG domain II-containing protein [Bacillota bacterium]